MTWQVEILGPGGGQLIGLQACWLTLSACDDRCGVVRGAKWRLPGNQSDPRLYAPAHHGPVAGDGRRSRGALVSTDLSATPAQLIARYADRWSIEQAIKDGKDLLGVGQAHNRLQTAVERTVPFDMLTLTILTFTRSRRRCWPTARSRRPATSTGRLRAQLG